MESHKVGWRETTLLGKSTVPIKQLTYTWSLVIPNTIDRRFRSTQRLKQLQRQTRGRVIPGHDKETFLALQAEKTVFT